MSTYERKVRDLIRQKKFDPAIEELCNFFTQAENLIELVEHINLDSRTIREFHLNQEFAHYLIHEIRMHELKLSASAVEKALENEILHSFWSLICRNRHDHDTNYSDEDLVADLARY